MDASQTAVGSGGNGMLPKQVNDTESESGCQLHSEDVRPPSPALPNCFFLQQCLPAPTPPMPIICSNSLVMELDNMDILSDKCNILFPMEVFNLLDCGKNPDDFIGNVINTGIAKNKVIKGKTGAFKELEQAFPDEVASWREI